LSDRECERWLSRAFHYIQGPGGFPEVYRVTKRVKEIDSVLGKLERKRKKDPTYDFSRLTDIAGLRMVTLYRTAIPELLRAFLHRIDQHQNISEAFSNIAIKEVLFLSNGSKDPIRSHVDNICYSEFKKMIEKYEIEERDSYSSVHLTLALHNIPHKSAAVSSPNRFICCEVQIRSVFEDAWSELEHAVIYSQIKQLPQDVSANREDRDREQTNASFVLKQLKRIVDLASDCADDIRERLLPSKTPPLAVQRTLDNRGSIEVFLDSVNVSDDLRRQIKSTMGDKLAIDQEVEQSGESERTQIGYLSMSEKFFDLEARLDSEVKNKDHPNENFLTYILKMEHALCLLLNGSPNSVSEAVNKYIEITNDQSNTDRPGALYRLAQARQRLWELGIADQTVIDENPVSRIVSDYRKSYELAKGAIDGAHVGEVIHGFSEQLEFIRSTALRHAGFLLWRVNKKDRDTRSGYIQSDIDMLKEAIELTLTAYNESDKVKDPDLHLRTANNISYFALEHQMAAVALKQDVRDSLSPDWIRCAFDELKTSVLKHAGDELPMQLETHSQWKHWRDALARMDTVLKICHFRNELLDYSGLCRRQMRVAAVLRKGLQGGIGVASEYSQYQIDDANQTALDILDEALNGTKR
jgi:ppGpp synthetase/RelA/SpoT-type nucleotidyltranferase